MKVSVKIEESFEGVLRVFKRSFMEKFKDVSRVFPEYFKVVSRKLSKKFHVHGTHHSFPSRRRACLLRSIGSTL